MFTVTNTNFNFSHFQHEDEIYFGNFTCEDSDGNVCVSRNFEVPGFAVPRIGSSFDIGDGLFDYLSPE